MWPLALPSVLCFQPQILLFEPRLRVCTALCFVFTDTQPANLGVERALSWGRSALERAGGSGPGKDGLVLGSWALSWQRPSCVLSGSLLCRFSQSRSRGLADLGARNGFQLSKGRKDTNKRTALAFLCGCQKESHQVLSCPFGGCQLGATYCHLERGMFSWERLPAGTARGPPPPLTEILRSYPVTRPGALPSAAKLIESIPLSTWTPVLWLIYISVFLSWSEKTNLGSPAVLRSFLCVLNNVRQYMPVLLLVADSELLPFLGRQF